MNMRIENLMSFIQNIYKNSIVIEPAEQIKNLNVITPIMLFILLSLVIIHYLSDFLK